MYTHICTYVEGEAYNGVLVIEGGKVDILRIDI